jgi:cell division protein FtsB
VIVLREMRRRLKTWVAPVFGIAATFYFAYHLVEGDRGLRAWVRVTQDLHVAKDNLAATSEERAALARKVAHLRPDQLDPDLLDAQVRRTLDVVLPDEIVIMKPADNKPADTK